MSKKVKLEMGYPAGNNSDQVKHSNLVCLAKELAPSMSNYTEFHSGVGIADNGYVGSSWRVINELRISGNDCPIYLHESNPENHNKLVHFLSKRYKSFYGANIVVNYSWRDNLEDSVRRLDKNSLVLIDPTDINAYSEKNGIFDNLELILSKNPSLFFFLPQRLNSSESKKHSRIVSLLKKRLDSHNAFYTDIIHSVEKGWFSRKDHNILVCDNSSVLKKVEENSKRASELAF